MIMAQGYCGYIIGYINLFFLFGCASSADTCNNNLCNGSPLFRCRGGGGSVENEVQVHVCVALGLADNYFQRFLISHISKFGGNSF